MAYLIHAVATMGLAALLLFGLSSDRASSRLRWGLVVARASFAVVAGVLWPVLAVVGVAMWLFDVVMGWDPYEWEDQAWAEEGSRERSDVED